MENSKNLYIFGFQEISVKEDVGNGRCIWCNIKRRFNAAHILSRKIIRNNHPQNVLRRSVCIECNSYFGNKIEDWFYKYSPLGTWGNQLRRPKGGVFTNLKYVPNFLWNDQMKEWIVINHDNVPDLLATQLLLDANDKLKTLHFDHTGKAGIEQVLEINKSIKDGMVRDNFTDYIDNKLPPNFSPRFFLYKGKLILVAQSQEDKVRLMNKLADKDDKASTYTLLKPDINGMKKMVVHYSWSLQRYFILCAKIGFEFMSFMKGQESCQDQRFAPFKKAIREAKFDKIIVPYVEGKGYQVNRLTPPGWVGFVKTGKDISGFPTMAGQKENCHSVFIYSVKGYLLFDIKLFALESCQLIIAKGFHLDEVYYVEYDIEDQTLRFFKMRKSDVSIDEKLDFCETLKTIRSDKNLAMVTLRDLSPPSLLQ